MVCVPAERPGISRMRTQLQEIELLEESEFLRLEYDLVAYYRRFTDDQEWIAVELTCKNMSASTPLARRRVAEILAMLDHVHDPLIAAHPEGSEPASAPHAVPDANPPTRRRSESSRSESSYS